MEAPKQSRSSSVDVSQLDKINAIPNKTTDDVLMEGLCHEDQLYLNVLMDNDSSNSDGDEFDASRQSSTWSPMLQNPVIMNRRLKKVRPSYAVTLSLEDISYIRPSWGISKGIRTIELNKKKKQLVDSQEIAKKNKKEKAVDDNSKPNKSKNEAALHYLLILLTFVIILLIVPTYMSKKKREQDRIVDNRIRLDKTRKFLEIFKPRLVEELEPILKVQFNEGLETNIKSEECECESFSRELNHFLKPNEDSSLFEYEDKNYTCFACLDWASRNNLRVLVKKTEKAQSTTNVGSIAGEEDTYCYHIKWQSYDSLATPLIDCFLIGDEQWFGFGDVQTSSWPLNTLNFNWTPLATNLTDEFFSQTSQSKSLEPNISLEPNDGQLNFGSFVNLSLFSTNAIFIGNLRTDFRISIKLNQESESGSQKICLMASCSDKCEQSWTRFDYLREFKHVNNVLEYTICSANSLRVLISNQIEEKTRALIHDVLSKPNPPETILQDDGKIEIVTKQTSQSLQDKKFAKLIEKESVSSTDGMNSFLNEPGLEPMVSLEGNSNMNNKHTSSSSDDQSIFNPKVVSDLPEGIGLIERTIFATSLESLPVLDGQTLRLYVDNIVKLGLKTSSILLIDSRWETYVGSLKLNIALFPKSKLLFEILHNKGFKIVLSIKPYIDSAIGISKINQLFESGRLYAFNYKRIRPNTFVDSVFQRQFKNLMTKPKLNTTKETIIRRTSFFSFQNHTIESASNDSSKFPYMFKCKESQEGYCALLDLTQSNNRMWFINNVKKSNALTVEANGIQIGGVHQDSFHWDDHYRAGVSELVKSLFYKEKLYTISQWTGDLGYIQMAPRQRDWNGLKSVINSVLNLGMTGFSLVHPGSVWGDLKLDSNLTQSDDGQKIISRLDSIYRDMHQSSSGNAELIIRWLQVSVFLPILQFNDIAPIEKYNLQELVQNLVRIRKIYVVPELKKYLPYTPTINQSRIQQSDPSSWANQLPLIRPVWFNHENEESMVSEQFSIGPDILVAPILSKGVKQRDIYLPSGFWHDELRGNNIRGGKWLKNYPVELTEIAWFTKAKR